MIEDAFAECRRIARASGSSFYVGMRLLPQDRRDGLFAVYALARRIDDIADGSLPAGDKLEALARLRSDLAAIEASRDPVLAAVAETARRFPLPLGAFDDLLDGAESDVRETTYTTFVDLVRYCRCVAGSIGRLSLGLFLCDDRAAAEPLADDLGVALQVGNILRDLGDDIRQGRLYLPAEDLDRFGCSLGEDGLTGPAELLVAFEAERGLHWLERGLGLIPLIDRRSAVSVLAMTGAYGLLLERIAREPRLALQTRVSLRGWEKGLVLARSMAGAGA